MERFNEDRGSGSAIGAAIGFIFGIALMVGINFVPGVKPLAQLLIVIFGLIFTVISASLYVLTKLYIKTPANGAFVRTGMGGQRVIIDGGTLFIPMFHEKLFISLETMKLEVVREGADALTTQDRVRIDMKSEFYIKVNKTSEAVVVAATSLGDKGVSQQNIIALVGDKLISALRTVAAKKNLEELFSDRQSFAEEVQKIVVKDLEANGLCLEAVTISKLDQTNYEKINVNNIFDAEGAKTVAEKVNAALVKKNEIEQTAKVAIETKNLEATKSINELKISREVSAAETGTKILNVQAEKKTEAEKFAAEQTRISKEAVIDSEREVGIKQVTMDKMVQTANIEKDQALAEKTIEKDKTVSQATIEKEKSILEKLAEKANADTTKSNAEAGAKKAQQNVITVEEVATAERKKDVSIITQKAVAENTKITQNAQTDIEAYKTTAIAEANKTAAVNRADAKIKEAEAEKTSKVLGAEGEKALQMVPVEVKAATVEVNAKQVEVTGKELEYKARYGEVSVKLETNLASIEANKEVGIAMAKALGDALNKANINLWGSPDSLQRVTEAFTKGQSQHIQLEALENGGFATARDSAKGLVVAYMKGLKTAQEVTGAADNVSAEVKNMVLEFVKSGGANTAAGIAMMGQFLLGGEKPTEDHLNKLTTLATTITNGSKKAVLQG